MAHGTPLPPLHGKIHHKFPFWLLEPLPKVQLIFSMRILEGVEWPISQADYNGPKQQWTHTVHILVRSEPKCQQNCLFCKHILQPALAFNHLDKSSKIVQNVVFWFWSLSVDAIFNWSSPDWWSFHVCFGGTSFIWTRSFYTSIIIYSSDYYCHEIKFQHCKAFFLNTLSIC